MKLFQTAQKDFVYLGVGPYDPTRKKQYNGYIFLYLFMCVVCIILTGVFVFFEANTFEDYTEGIYILSASILSPIAVMSIVLQLQKLFKLIERCENIFDSRMKFEASKRLYEKAAQQAEQWSKWISILAIKVTPIGGNLFVLIGSFFFYFVYDLGNDSFMLAVPMWFPFDWKNPIGYLAAVFVEYVMALYGFLVISTLATVAIGGYLYALTATKDMIRMLEDMNKNGEVKENRSHIFNQLSEFIQFHSDVKQVVKGFSDLYQPVFAFVFTWSLVTMTGAMLMIQIEIESHKEKNTVRIVTMAIEIFCAFGSVLFTCELGERLSAAFNNISDLIDQFKWYIFPNNAQRIFPIILITTQQPIAIECFGSISCLREALKSVINTAFSYFMVLREFKY